MFDNNSSIRRIYLATAVDENYLKGLLVLIKSILTTLSANNKLVFFILNVGLNSGSRKKIMSISSDDLLELHFIDFNPQPLIKFSKATLNYISSTTYARFFLSSLLPQNTNKIIYLDSDVLVQKDISLLWRQAMYFYPFAAVQDFALPYIDSSIRRDFSYKKKWIFRSQPIKNFKELKLKSTSMYFNAGVFITKLNYWRKNKIEEKLLQVLRVNSHLINFGDQDVLNIIFSSKWKKINPRWNQQSFIYNFPSSRHSPFNKKQFEMLKKDPWIIHFSEQKKPWKDKNCHPAQKLFESYL